MSNLNGFYFKALVVFTLFISSTRLISQTLIMMQPLTEICINGEEQQMGISAGIQRLQQP
jgi:hypothetical protein